MMTRNRQIREEEVLAPRDRIDPCQSVIDRGWLIYAEARFVVPSDVAGIFKDFETAPANHGFHSEVTEPSRMEHRCVITNLPKSLRQRDTGSGGVVVSSAIERRERRAQHGVQTLNAFRVGDVRVVEYNPAVRQRGQIGSEVVLAAVERQILRGGGFEAHEDDVPTLGTASKTGKILAAATCEIGSAPVAGGRF